MAKERTLSIIKPDGVCRNIIGKLLSRFENNGLQVVAMKMIHLTKREAEGFYAVHKERPFFSSLTDYMSSGPIVVQVLEGENAIARNREIMGATNPAEAEEGSIRKDYALDIEQNTVHGSDSAESAANEVVYFFANMEMVHPS